jgi:surface antigen
MSVAQSSTAGIKQQEQIKTRRKAKVKIKPSMIAVYASVFTLVIAIISTSYHQPQSSTGIANAASVSSVSSTNQPSVDSVVAATVAASVAQSTNLPVANDVSNSAVSAQITSEIAQSIDTSMSSQKPQIVESTTENRLVTSYVVQSGDTVDTLATKFKISAQTIKWANNLTTNSLIIGSTLRILPVDGILYTVKESDTADSIASKYGVDKTRFITFNDLDVSGVKPNTSIILPGGILPDNERPGYTAPVIATTNYYAGLGTGFGGNTWNIGRSTGACPGYGYGQCTCYAYARRLQLGLPVGDHWGNASSWVYYARSEGRKVNRAPSRGAIIQNGGGAGHVAIVESILPNGDLSISEMNAHVYGGGWNIVSGRIIPAGNISQYLYIH